MVTRALHPGRRARAASPRAFTLLELLVAMLLATMVALMAAATVRMTVRGVGDITTDRQRGAREERVRALLAAQLAWLELDDARAPIRFAGNKRGIDAQTMCTLATPHRRERATARWRLIERADEQGVFDLFYTETSTWRDGEGATGAEVSADEAQAREAALGLTLDDNFDVAHARPVLLGLRQAELAYIGSGSGVSWTDEWHGPGLPRAVRVTLVTREGGRSEWVVPVAVTF